MNINQPCYYKLWDVLSDICPVVKSSLTECPLTFLRNMGITQRLAWFMAQKNHDQILKLAIYHQQCKRIQNKSIPIKAAAVLPPGSVSIP